MTAQLQAKLKDALEYTLEAYDHAPKGNKYNVLNNARKAGEAICKVVIYKELGDDLGDDFLQGSNHGERYYARQP